MSQDNMANQALQRTRISRAAELNVMPSNAEDEG